MSPVLMAGEFVFLSFSDAHYGDYSDLTPVASMIEGEGLTLVIPREKADERELRYDSVFRQITLSIHSSLEAVGLTASFSRALADCGVSSNVIAGYFHDHIFVPASLAEVALAAIEDLSRSSVDEDEARS
jgi:hypothetical protein